MHLHPILDAALTLTVSKKPSNTVLWYDQHQALSISPSTYKPALPLKLFPCLLIYEELIAEEGGSGLSICQLVVRYEHHKVPEDFLPWPQKL